MARPLIGITIVGEPDPACARTGGQLRLNWNYADLVSSAGGSPVLIPPQTDPHSVAGVLDGLIIPGGKDIDPARYGADLHPQADLELPARFELEKRLLEALPATAPVLGICYGCQLLNVLRGGTLEQHIPERVGHEQHTHGELQTYEVCAGSRLIGLTGQSARGESWHHQAILRAGEGVSVVAKAADSTIEAIEVEGHPWMLGVQWHPERTPDDATTVALLRSFMEQAERCMELRMRPVSVA